MKKDIKEEAKVATKAKKEDLEAEDADVDSDEKVIDAAAADPSEVEAVDSEAIGKDEDDFHKKSIKRKADVSGWSPKTDIGMKVKEGTITTIDEVLDSGYNILEVEITDTLLPDMESELLLIGQSKGKFGGGQRRVFRQTQKKTKEGNKPKFSTFAIIGNNDGFVGCGYGKAKETVPAREKAIRKAKLNIIKIRRGCGSWECHCASPHSIPFEVRGKCGSTEVKLMPAPKGTGLCVEKECAKILKAAGIKDVWAKSYGQTKTKLNMIKACIEALKQLSETKIRAKTYDKLGVVQGSKSKQ